MPFGVMYMINLYLVHTTDDMESPHGVANNEGNPVSDKDILKAESLQPNEMHDLHNLLKSSNDVNAKNRHRDFNSESKFMSPEDLSEQGGTNKLTLIIWCMRSHC